MPFMKFNPWLLLSFLTLMKHSRLCLYTALQRCSLSQLLCVLQLHLH